MTTIRYTKTPAAKRAAQQPTNGTRTLSLATSPILNHLSKIKILVKSCYASLKYLENKKPDDSCDCYKPFKTKIDNHFEGNFLQ